MRADQLAMIELAHRFGFESVEAQAEAIAKSPAGELAAKLKELGLVWGTSGLPVEFRQGDARLDEDLKRLPSLAKALAREGVTRVSTWFRAIRTACSRSELLCDATGTCT